MARLQEIEAEISQLKAEESIEWEKEKTRREAESKERQRQEKLALERQSEESARRVNESIEREARERKAAEERSNRGMLERLVYLSTLLPLLSEMPLCPECNLRMKFESIPPVVVPFQRFYGNKPTPMTMLVCDNGHHQAARFENENFPMAFEPMPFDF